MNSTDQQLRRIAIALESLALMLLEDLKKLREEMSLLRTENSTSLVVKNGKLSISNLSAGSLWGVCKKAIWPAIGVASHFIARLLHH